MLQESKVLKFLGFMWNPLSWVMEAAAIMAIALAHGGKNLRGKVIINHCHIIHSSPPVYILIYLHAENEHRLP